MVSEKEVIQNNENNDQNQSINILQTTDFIDQLTELSTVTFNISSSRNKPTLEQTKRNNIRYELLNGLYNHLCSITDPSIVSIYRTKEGVALEVFNEDVYKKQQESGMSNVSGSIVMTLGLKMESLDYDVYEQGMVWEEDDAKRTATMVSKKEKEAKKQKTEN